MKNANTKPEETTFEILDFANVTWIRIEEIWFASFDGHKLTVFCNPEGDDRYPWVSAINGEATESATSMRLAMRRCVDIARPMIANWQQPSHHAYSRRQKNMSRDDVSGYVNRGGVRGHSGLDAECISCNAMFASGETGSHASLPVCASCHANDNATERAEAEAAPPQFLAVGNNAWAIAGSIAGAKKKCRSFGAYRQRLSVYQLPAGAATIHVNDLGIVTWQRPAFADVGALEHVAGPDRRDRKPNYASLSR